MQKITGSPTVDRPLQRIREFRNRPNPAIVVSVDMMSTGVDIPDLEYIVFLRPVKSRILFEQMLGRGTRKGYKHPDKSHFTVFDCFDGTLLQYFREATAITAEEPVPPTRTLHEIIEDIWANRDRDYNIRCLAKRLLRVDKEMHGDARKDFAAFLPDGDVATFAKNRYGTLKDNFTGTMTLLTIIESHGGRLWATPPIPGLVQHFNSSCLSNPRHARPCNSGARQTATFAECHLTPARCGPSLQAVG